MNALSEAQSYRFWRRINMGPGCWEWQGYRSTRGYGRVRSPQGKLLYAHRIAYEDAFGSTGDLHVLHKCDNPSCCNPTHLFLGTQGDNMADRQAKKRQARGERSGSAKLTAAAVVRIRELSATGHKQQEIARDFGVHFGTVNDVVLGKTWRHV